MIIFIALLVIFSSACATTNGRKENNFVATAALFHIQNREGTLTKEQIAGIENYMVGRIEQMGYSCLKPGAVEASLKDPALKDLYESILTKYSETNKTDEKQLDKLCKNLGVKCIVIAHAKGINPEGVLNIDISIYNKKENESFISGLLDNLVNTLTTLILVQ